MRIPIHAYLTTAHHKMLCYVSHHSLHPTSLWLLQTPSQSPNSIKANPNPTHHSLYHALPHQNTSHHIYVTPSPHHTSFNPTTPHPTIPHSISPHPILPHHTPPSQGTRHPATLYPNQSHQIRPHHPPYSALSHQLYIPSQSTTHHFRSLYQAAPCFT